MTTPLITRAPFGLAQNKWLENVSNDEHHGMQCISSSMLKYIHKGHSMEDFHYNYILKEAKKEKVDAFRVGTIAHLAVLEPEIFVKNVFVCDLDQKTNAFKEFRLELVTGKKADTAKRKKCDLAEEERTTLIETKSGGYIHLERNEEIFICSSEEMRMFEKFMTRAAKHAEINKMLTTSVIEQSGVAQDPETGLWMSLRGDARNNKGYFADPKTIDKHLTTENIRYYFKDYGLAIQAAHYIETANLIEPGKYKHFWFIMMSKKAPYELALVKLGPTSLAWGVRKRREILNKIAACEQADLWPGLDARDDGARYMSIELPEWELRN
jgi:hypothetical protein